MPVQSCRVCGREFFREPLLHFANMPKAAQNFPDAGTLAGDRGVDLTVCQCSGCGLVQLAGDPVPYYREVIRASAVSPELKESKTAQFRRFVEKYDLRGKAVLEIGCGRGDFLSLLAALGEVRACGLEYAEASVARCLQDGLAVTRGYVEHAGTVLAGAPFDAFLLLMFLEHLPDPNAALQGIARNLKDGAVGLVEVPSFDMVLRNNLFSEFIGDHLFYFTRETLQTTLNLNGFEILEFSELRNDYVLSAVVKKRASLDLSRFRDTQAAIRAGLAACVARFGAKRVAVWGAGHQALAILALMELAGGIRYVVDGAPFKQNKFTPATHLPIVAPDTLRTDPVDAVIVIAGSYSDEVAGILRAKFDPRLSVFILRESGLETV